MYLSAPGRNRKSAVSTNIGCKRQQNFQLAFKFSAVKKVGVPIH
jgi:hypothetical protein